MLTRGFPPSTMLLYDTVQNSYRWYHFKHIQKCSPINSKPLMKRHICNSFSLSNIYQWFLMNRRLYNSRNISLGGNKEVDKADTACFNIIFSNQSSVVYTWFEKRIVNGNIFTVFIWVQDASVCLSGTFLPHLMECKSII